MNAEKLIADGYKIENAGITSADLSMEDHGCLTLNMTIEGGGWVCVYGGYCIGRGYLGAGKFEGNAKGNEYIMRIMDTVGVSKFSDLSGKYIRVATKGWGSCVKIIGNIINDQWFDPEEFFADSCKIEQKEKENAEKPINIHTSLVPK